jgi:dTDP-glucose pyrophosphorylase
MSLLDIFIGEDATIREVIQIIENTERHIVLVVDKDEQLLGTITDGDIRSALLYGKSLEDPVKDMYSIKPVTATDNCSKEEVIKLCIEHKVYQIPIINNTGKVIRIDLLDELIVKKSYPNKVVLMVGGLGARLKPLTDNIPKPMLKVGDRPILETIILNFKKNGFKNIILSVGYKSEVIKDYFGDGSCIGVNIEYVYENKRMGTVGALSLIKNKLNESFFVMNGDLLTNINFEHMLDYHLKNKSIATMGVREYDFQVPYGVVNMDGINIKSIEEKPVHNFFVSGGVYILNPEVLKYIPDDKFYDMPTLFEKLIDNKRPIISFHISEYWLDIGKINEFEKANKEYGRVFSV